MAWPAKEYLHQYGANVSRSGVAVACLHRNMPKRRASNWNGLHSGHAAFSVIVWAAAAAGTSACRRPCRQESSCAVNRLDQAYRDRYRSDLVGGGVVGAALKQLADAILLAVALVDMRTSIDGLSLHVYQALGRAPCDGTAHVFSNRRRTRLKVVCWVGTSVWMCLRRLHRGQFWPEAVTPAGRSVPSNGSG